MESILNLYEQAYHPARPRVCFDETTKQLIEGTRLPLPAKLGQVQRYNYEYRRNDTRNLFLKVTHLAAVFRRGKARLALENDSTA
jgi:hypothetical protein